MKFQKRGKWCTKDSSGKILKFSSEEELDLYLGIVPNEVQESLDFTQEDPSEGDLEEEF